MLIISSVCLVILMYFCVLGRFTTGVPLGLLVATCGTGGGDKWTVKLDVRDLGGHLDTTFRRWSATLAPRVRLVIAHLVLIFVLPLDSHGRLMVILKQVLRKLRTAIFKVVWSRRQPLANDGAVLSLLYGPQACDPACCVVWFRFRMLRRCLAYRPREVARVYRLLDSVAEGCPGHGPVHLLVDSAAEIGFAVELPSAWVERPGLPVLVLSNLAGPIQHFGAAVLEAWRDKFAADLCERKGFRGAVFGCSWYIAAP